MQRAPLASKPSRPTPARRCAAGACARCSPRWALPPCSSWWRSLVSSRRLQDGAKSRPGAAQKAAGTGAIPGQKESAEMLAGIPQSGIYLGNPSAPVRLVEFADLQCPFCREYTLQTLPQLVQDYVRSGKVRMEFRDLAFLGKDSVTAGRHAAAAARAEQALELRRRLLLQPGRGELGLRDAELPAQHRQGRRGRLGQGRRLRRVARVADADQAGQRAGRPAGRAVDADRPRGQARRRAASRSRPGPPTWRRSSRPSTGCWGRREHRPAPAPRRDRPGRHRPRASRPT